ncbi:fimbria/pilus outer membrane usher protein [Rhodoferax sp.]|uniref:fimbria/pilus outer membrane usher protein n=1 Tax=Rhodoferax sp. TaxID=50421 RepID=UPI0037843836
MSSHAPASGLSRARVSAAAAWSVALWTALLAAPPGWTQAVQAAPLPAPQAQAQVPALTQVPARSQVLVLGLVLNGIDVSEGEPFVETPTQGLLVGADLLQRLQLRPDARAMRGVAGVPHFDLYALPGVQVQRDTASARVILVARASAFESQVLDALAAENLQAPSYSPGGFFNYELGRTQTPQELSYDGLLGVGGFAGPALMTHSLALRQAHSVRLMSSVQIDSPHTIKTLRLGDAITSTGAWGIGALFGGLQYETNFAVRPEFVVQSIPSVAGDAVLPSTVDVYVDNVLRSRQNVEAGPFVINNLPLVNGKGEIRMVVRDVLGREQVVTQPFLASATLLRPGLLQESYELGALRRNYGTQSDDYGDPFASMTLRRGMRPRWTAELRAEVQRDARTVGLSHALLFPAWSSVAEATMVASSAEQVGGAYGLLYSFTGNRVSLGARVTGSSADFRQVGGDVQNAPSRQWTLQAALPMGSGTLITNYLSRASHNREQGDVKVLHMNYAWQLHARVTAQVSLLSTNALAGVSLLAGITAVWDSKHISTVSAQRAPQSDSVYVDYAQVAPGTDGLDYRLAAARVDGLGTQQVDLSLKHPRGRWSAQLVEQEAGPSTRLGASGGVAVLGRQVHWTRGLPQSFAVVHVGEPGVPVYLEGQLAARTGADGSALVGNLRAYQNNLLSIDPLTIPMDHLLNTTHLTVRPRWLGGVRADFGVAQVIGGTVSVLYPDGSAPPAWSEVQVLGLERIFVVGGRGDVYLEFPKPGSYRMRVAPQGHAVCQFDLVVDHVARMAEHAVCLPP